jgi:hypothetical protein
MITIVMSLWLVAAGLAVPQAPKPPESMFRGRITDSTGGALPGVEVTFTSAFIERRVVTGASGEFQIALPHASYELKAVLSGFRTIDESIWISDSPQPRVWEAQMRIGRIEGFGDAGLLEKEIARRAGSDAVSCGVLGPDATEARLKEALECITRSTTAGQGAWTRVGLWRMDSFAAVGVVAAKDGTLRYFYADQGRRDFTSCGRPKAVYVDRQWQFACDAKQ